MQFHNPLSAKEELTYEDVFLFQNYFDGKSRLDVEVKPVVDLWTTLPIVSANMNAVSWKRMAETIARYGWLAVLPQDMDNETLERIIKYVKSADIQYDTPITLGVTHTIRDAMGIIYKRDHNCVILIDDIWKAIDIFEPHDFEHLDQFSLLGKIRKSHLITGQIGISDEESFDLMEEKSVSSLPIVDNQGVLKWILTKKHAIRNSVYTPSLDKQGALDVAVAVWLHRAEEKISFLRELGIRTFVLDTAHGYQKNMLESIQRIRGQFGDTLTLIAWNVMSAAGTRALLQAWANGVKVGIWPGAMCTTRMKTGVGRPQFTAVLECSTEAKKLWWFVRADGWIQNPRDMNLALAAWANHVMIGTLFAWTFESVWDVRYDENGLMYKENYGMASPKAVSIRNGNLSPFEKAKKQMFREWISTSRIYIKPGKESVWDIIDEFITWLRSAMAYVGTKNLKEFHEKAIIGVQTRAWFVEGTPHGKIRK